MLKEKNEGNLLPLVGYRLLMESSVLLFDYTVHSTGTQIKKVSNNFFLTDCKIGLYKTIRKTDKSALGWKGDG